MKLYKKPIKMDTRNIYVHWLVEKPKPSNSFFTATLKVLAISYIVKQLVDVGFYIHEKLKSKNGTNENNSQNTN